MKTQSNQNQNKCSNSQSDEKRVELVGSENDVGGKIRDFSELLEKIESLDDKKKRLWKEIYINSVTDRQNSFVMFKELYELVKGKGTEHAVHAKSMTSYLERMAKCNDQLIKLAELIADAQSKSESINFDDMYEQIAESQSPQKKKR